MFPFLVELITVFIILDFIPSSQERHHWIKHVGICVIIANFDVDNRVSLSVPKAPDEYVTPCLQTVTPLTYLPF